MKKIDISDPSKVVIIHRPPTHDGEAGTASKEAAPATEGQAEGKEEADPEEKPAE